MCEYTGIPLFVDCWPPARPGPTVCLSIIVLTSAWTAPNHQLMATSSTHIESRWRAPAAPVPVYGANTVGKVLQFMPNWRCDQMPKWGWF
jgi:hypothetical protein